MTDVKAGPQPSAIPPPDRSQLERLNTLYRIIDQAPAGAGLKARLATSARRLLGRILSRQQEFNAAVVEHINRNMALGLEAHHASANTIEWMAGTIDGYRDARDEVERHLEALLARERRNDTAVRALAAQHEELRSALSVVQQAAHNLKREVEKVSAGNPNSQIPNSKSQESNPESRIPNPGLSSQFDDLDSHKYVGFEDQFRGSPADIRRRVEDYLPVFENASDVLDVGCGRGEFLELLRDRGVRAQGIDINPAMVEVCRGKGLQAETGDALAYLGGVPDGSLGGLFAAQVVEHLEPRYLMRLLDAAFDKLRPGAPIVLETINPACWFAFFESYIRDLTHVRPVHPDTLKYLLVATGFQRVEIRYQAPYPEADKLQTLAHGRGAPTSLDDMIETLNANVEKINRLLFTYLDYAAIGVRG
ncbi:MAG TPA: class I SAM-dependent methyltransferase [Vicinamibacterales bacterium]|nr:class I SAM-dependent methyltransferase [Vicinamibacterales bacterium]